METLLLNGLDASRALEEALKGRYVSLKNNATTVPHLAILLVGDHAPSLRYIAAKKKAAERVGFRVSVYQVDAKTEEEELLKLVQKLNHDKEVHGIIVQLPTPDKITSLKLLNAVSPSKDVDGLTFESAGFLFQGEKTAFVV